MKVIISNNSFEHVIWRNLPADAQFMNVGQFGLKDTFMYIQLLQRNQIKSKVTIASLRSIPP